MPNQGTRRRRQQHRERVQPSVAVSTAAVPEAHQASNPTTTQQPTPPAPSVSPLPALAPSYTGHPPSTIKNAFFTTLALNKQSHNTLSLESLTRAFRHPLEQAILESILEGVQRLPPHDTSPEGLHRRAERERTISARATERETAFVRVVRAYAPSALDEAQQRALGLPGGTPDVRFEGAEVVLCGAPCRWIEYKSFFGHKRDPFVYRKNLKQFVRYGGSLGPGVVVYGLGFEEGLLDGTSGVRCLREEEVVAWLRAQSPVVEGGDDAVEKEDGVSREVVEVGRKEGQLRVDSGTAGERR